MILNRKKRLLTSALFVIIGVFALLGPGVVLAQDLGLSYGAEVGLPTSDVRTVVARIINVVLSLLGVVCVCLMLYAGFVWMTSGGNDEKIKKAQKTIWATVIGLIIITSAYAITQFVTNEVYYGSTGQNYRR